MWWVPTFKRGPDRPIATQVARAAATKVTHTKQNHYLVVAPDLEGVQQRRLSVEPPPDNERHPRPHAQPAQRAGVGRAQLDGQRVGGAEGHGARRRRHRQVARAAAGLSFFLRQGVCAPPPPLPGCAAAREARSFSWVAKSTAGRLPPQGLTGWWSRPCAGLARRRPPDRRPRPITRPPPQPRQHGAVADKRHQPRSGQRGAQRLGVLYRLDVAPDGVPVLVGIHKAGLDPPNMCSWVRLCLG
jgi:hypothetical protein